MKRNKILLIILLLLFVTGCKNINKLSYNEIIDTIQFEEKSPNTYRRGYKYYIPKGLSIYKAGTNYAIIRSNNYDYYMFVDLISYNSNKTTNHAKDNNALYYTIINNGGKKGYAQIKKYKNNQYLIEIMYNYAKIEVMVDDRDLKVALTNTVNILKSVDYDKDIIEALLKEDNLIYTEEIFNMFDKSNKKSGVLNYMEEETIIDNDDNNIKDTDFVN